MDACEDLGLVFALLIVSQHKGLFSLAEKQEEDASHLTSVQGSGRAAAAFCSALCPTLLL